MYAIKVKTINTIHILNSNETFEKLLQIECRFH